MSIGSMSGAAEALHLTQPALSKQISSLEETLGLRLFNRRRGGALRPTPEGLSFFKSIEGTLYGLEAIPGIAEEIGRKARIQLRIAATPPLINSGPFMSAVAKFRTEATHVKLSLTSLQRIDLEDWVLNRQANVSLGLLPTQHSELSSVTLAKTSAVAVMPVAHRLASKDRICLSDLKDVPLILPTRQLLRERIDKQVPGLSAEIETSSSITSTGLAVSQNCVAICDPFSPTMYPEGFARVLPFEPSIALEYGAILPKLGFLDPVVELFLEILRGNLGDIGVQTGSDPDRGISSKI